jgi:NAD-dependent deacetylase
LRPAVVLFDEPLPVDAEWSSKKALRDCDLFLAVGTSGTVSPASNFVRAAEYAGARTVFVNLEPMTPHNPAFHEVVLGRAEELLPMLLAPSDTL